MAVVCTSPSLGLEFSDGLEHEVLALVDRSDIATMDPSQHDSQTFYAFADEADVVHIRWYETVPAGWRIVGRLLYAQMPMIKRPGQSRTHSRTHLVEACASPYAQMPMVKRPGTNNSA